MQQIMTADFPQTYFELFHLPQSYGIDLTRLDTAYRDLQSQVHPDRFAAAPEAERRRSMQWATFANEAYQTLKKPLSRARYLLKLNGIDTEEETNTAMPAHFLMKQMEWREAVAEAKQRHDGPGLHRLAGQLGEESKVMLAGLEVILDAQADYAKAAASVRELRFLQKLQEDIDEALAVTEG